MRGAIEQGEMDVHDLNNLLGDYRVYIDKKLSISGIMEYWNNWKT